MKTIINTENAPAPLGPYSQAIKLDNTLYVSGQIAINPKTNELINSNIEVETDMVMSNIGAILKEAGMDYSNVVKCSIFIKDMNQFSEINEVYGKYFIENSPARETVEVARLPKDLNIEISVVAAE
ncbi:MAG: RidA family protein [Flavobacteriales bacterium]|nr:RidA family protein [Flavobacteriales bacterium]